LQSKKIGVQTLNYKISKSQSVEKNLQMNFIKIYKKDFLFIKNIPGKFKGESDKGPFISFINKNDFCGFKEDG
jgi:hypothetical protein